MVPARLLTAKQVEALTDGGITARRAQQVARLGLFPPGTVVRIGRQLRFSERALLAFLEAGGASLPEGWRWRKPPEEEHQVAAAATGGV